MDMAGKESGTTTPDLLLDLGLTQEALDRAVGEMSQTGASLLGTLVRMEALTSAQVVEVLSKQYNVPSLDIDAIDEPEEDALEKVPRRFATKHRIVPIRRDGSRLEVAFADPSALTTMDDLKFLTGLEIDVVVAADDAIARAIERFYAPVEIEMVQEDEEEETLADLERSAGSAPIVRAVNLLLVDAIRKGASDIHIELMANQVRVRLRVDGVLSELVRFSVSHGRAIVSRVKIMSDLNIAERRLPQDGRMNISLTGGRSYDFRVSVMPFQHGEKIVMRLLDRASLQTDMTKLGFDPVELKVFHKAIHQPNGIILVTGPTGSGKTTTLYSALQELNRIETNISTVEDPIEYELHGVSQCQIHDGIGLTFAHALRSFLRQDPDVIMVGEIRDFETAEIAIKAALTGHLVLSTLHTNDAASTITRLLNMGIEPFLVTGALNLIVAQRLIRRVCEQCRAPYRWEREACLEAGMTAAEYEAAQTVRGSGCSFCNQTGLKGRVAVYELLVVTDRMRDAILEGHSGVELKRMAINEGMNTLRTSALRKFAEGLTTLEEVLRVTRAD